MAQKSSFFTSINGDRKYKAEDFANYFKTFIGNGVFPNPSNNLIVTSNGDMTITVSPGYAFINGYMYSNTDDLILTHNVSDSILNRIDRVVVRCDFSNREITVVIKQGESNSNPTAPTLQRDTTIYELGIADILINRGSISILQSNITDTRLNNDLCGIVTQTVNEIDTSELYLQLQGYIEENGKNLELWTDEQKQFFLSWFEDVKGLLNEDIAGNLINRVVALEEAINGSRSKLISLSNSIVDLL